MSMEQDDEKIINAAAQSASQLINAGIDVASSLHKPKAKAKKNSAQDDLKKARQDLKKGLSKEQVEESLSKSPTAIKIKEKGNNVRNYVSSIVRKAQIENRMEEKGVSEPKLKPEQEQSIER